MTQRRHTRHVVTPRLYVAIDGSSAGGILHDVSDGGVSLDVVGPAPAGERVLLDFDMSETGEHFEGFGRIIWNNESKNRVGFQFVNLPDASRNKVRNWLSAKSASPDTWQNMVVQDRSEPTSVDIPAGLRERIGTTATSVALDRPEEDLVVTIAVDRTPWRTELERILPSSTTTDSLPTKIHAEAFTDLRGIGSKDAKDPTLADGIHSESDVLDWTVSPWNDVRRWFLWVPIICLAIIFLGLGTRILKKHLKYHTARSFFSNLWSPSVPTPTASPKIPTSALPPTKSPQTADRITDLSTGNRPPAINQFEVMDAQNGRRYLPRTGTNVVIQAQKSLPPPPANANGPSERTNAVNAGRVSQRSSGELPVVATIPEYPTFALQTNVQGRVVLNAVISRDGTLHNVHLLSPSSMLDSTVLDAVKKWRYQPHYENGKAKEVDTQITVDFSITTE
jgi:TonB family protein